MFVPRLREKPDEAANVLFVEATKLISQAKAKEDAAYKAAIADYEKALELIQKIADKYPETDLAVKLVSNETMFTGQTLAQIKARMDWLHELRSEPRKGDGPTRKSVGPWKCDGPRKSEWLEQNFCAGNLKRDIRCSPPPPSDLMARFTSGHMTKSSMPSMATVGSSHGNLKREVVCPPLPPSVLMARFTSGHLTTSSMPSRPIPQA